MRSRKPHQRSGNGIRFKLHTFSATIVGVGNVGRHVAQQLVALGIPRLTVIDPAVVKLRDVKSAGFFFDDVGTPKVDAIGGICHRANPQLDFTGIKDRFRRNYGIGRAIFCCGGSPRQREAIRRYSALHCQFRADVRIAGDRISVLTALNRATRRADSAHPTVLSRPLICNAAIGASLAVYQLIRHLRKNTPRSLQFDIVINRIDVTNGD